MTLYEPDIERLLGGGSRELTVTENGRALLAHIESGMGGAYEGADRFSRELALWSPALMSADREVFEAKDITDARTRDIVRNDPLVAHGSVLQKDNIVGSFYLLNCKPELRILGWDEGWAQEFQEEVETKFTVWAESPNNWFDAQRVNTFTGLVRLAVGIYLAAGEVLAASEWIRDDPLRLYKTALQMIDVDRLSNPFGAMDTDNIKRGVEKDRRGAPIAYYIREAHPTDWTNLKSYLWKRIPRIKPWGRLQVIHIYEQGRPDQTRGISDMVAILKETRMGRKFRDITLQNAVVNASYAASIESDLPSEAVFQALGGGNMGTTDMGEVITEYAAAFLGAIAEYTGSSKNIHLDGVKIPHLFPGTRLQLRPAGTPGGVGTDFESSLNRYLAANLGVSYEELTKDFTRTNYSGFKGGLNETRKHMGARKKGCADRFATAGFGLWFEEAMNNGELETMRGKEAHFYEGINKDAYLTCDWIGASVGQIDELKETQAAALRRANLLTTHEDELGRLGKDWRKVFRQIAREKKLMEELGIEIVQTNAANAATGDTREPENTSDARTEAPEVEADAEIDERPNPLGALIETFAASQESLGKALATMAAKPSPKVEVYPETPVLNVQLRPQIKVDVHTQRNGRTITKVLAHDDKGRILSTQTEPVDED